MKYINLIVLISALGLMSGCAGQVYNKEKNCSYGYLLHPAISVSKMIGGCGPVADYQK